MQFEIYRRMTPQERLLHADRLYWSARALREAAERARHPEWSEDEVKSHVRRVFLLATT
jgi:hypothetical protein